MQFKVLCILTVCLCVCATVFAAEHQTEESKLSPFAGSFADALWTIIAFVVLMLALWKLAWKPLLAGLNARQEHIEKEISDADQTRKQAEEILAEYQAKIQNAERDGKKIIDAHLKQAQQQSKHLLEDARAQIETIKSKAQDDITRAKRQAQEELLVESGEIVLQLGQEILGRSITEQDNQKLIDQAVERLRAEESN